MGTADLHPDDEKQLFDIRRQLIGWRAVMRRTQQEVSLAAGCGKGGLHELEAGKKWSRLSRMQGWARAFDLRLYVDLHFEDTAIQGMVARDPEVAVMAHMRDESFEADHWDRMWLVAALASARRASQIDSAEMARRLGITRGAVTLRDQHKSDPLLPNLMIYARNIGCQVKLDLLDKDQWKEWRDL